jgi:fatty-acyl-CoA synthase
VPTDLPERRGNPLDSWVRALKLTAPIRQSPTTTFPVIIDQLAAKHDGAPALLGEHEVLSFRDLAARSHFYTRWALGQGIASGDVVCLLMPNCPDYFALWVGITRVGGVVALININLSGDALAHSIAIVASKHIIVAAELVSAATPAMAGFAGTARFWAHGGGDHGLPRIDPAGVSLIEDWPADEDVLVPSLSDRALYIYTSGTTGLPKAASVSHFRIMQWVYWFAGLTNMGPDDRMYNCMPMYHSIGGVVAVGAPLVSGASVVIREKFSARRFWDDVVLHRCTLFQYIGELCRYLVNSPEHPRETQHQLRLACGNGLRGDIWELFQQRFQIPRILEFYAATEISFSLYNCEGKPGAIGRIPPFLAHRFGVSLIKTDIDTAEPLRDENGFCIKCGPGETGEAIGNIGGDEASGRGFEGYTDPQATARKLLKNVFAPGDCWLRSGDLMRRDTQGFFFFIDRLGDTFRWRGENVSTTEVAEALASVRGVTEAVVYGVAVPHTEGRAGMAVITINHDFDLGHLHDQVREQLPDYARPLFLRIRDEIEATGTFKPKKTDLVNAGFDPGATADQLYFRDVACGRFVLLDPPLYNRLLAGEVRI